MSGETAVQIFGTTYVVKGEDPGRVREVADYLDRRMRELLADKPGGVSVKAAVLTALNLTDELFRAREETERLRAEVEERSQRLLAVLD